MAEDIFGLMVRVMDICTDLEAQSEQITVGKIERILANEGEALDQKYIKHVLSRRKGTGPSMIMLRQNNGSVSLAYRIGKSPIIHVVKEWSNISSERAAHIAAELVEDCVSEEELYKKPYHEAFHPEDQSLSCLRAI